MTDAIEYRKEGNVSNMTAARRVSVNVGRLKPSHQRDKNVPSSIFTSPR